MFLVLTVMGAAAQSRKKPPSELTQKEAAISVLLVSNGNGTGKGAIGVTSTMTLNASKSNHAGQSSNWELAEGSGRMMRQSLRNVRRFVEKFRGWPNGYELRLGFSDQAKKHDGVSVSLAAALLLDALITGGRIDPGICVTGELTDNGSIRAVKHVREKIEAAVRQKQKVAIVPLANEDDVRDLLVVNDSLVTLCEIQIVGVNRFSLAQKLAAKRRSADVQRSLTQFGRIAEVLKRRRADSEALLASLRSPQIMKALKGVLASNPNHLSAKVLLLCAEGSQPTCLSLSGSLIEIDVASEQIIDATRNLRQGALEFEQIESAMEELDANMKIIEPSAHSYANAVKKYGQLLLDLDGQRPSAEQRNQLHKAAVDIDTQRRTLSASPR